MAGQWGCRSPDDGEQAWCDKTAIWKSQRFSSVETLRFSATNCSCSMLQKPYENMPHNYHRLLEGRCFTMFYFWPSQKWSNVHFWVACLSNMIGPGRPGCWGCNLDFTSVVWGHRFSKVTSKEGKHHMWTQLLQLLLIVSNKFLSIPVQEKGCRATFVQVRRYFLFEDVNVGR